MVFADAPGRIPAHGWFPMTGNLEGLFNWLSWNVGMHQGASLHLGVNFGCLPVSFLGFGFARYVVVIGRHKNC